MLDPSTELQQIFLDDRPLIDVRAAIEFARGAFPNAINLPLLDDAERHEVGVCYKNEGAEAALRLGHRLVSGELKTDRIAAWVGWLATHPEAMIYCFRGGQRSRIACQWLAAEGFLIPRVPGGYKMLRRCLVATFQTLPPLMLISGRTGTGKTQLLNHFLRKLDLEGCARHRGSAFGKLIVAQPAQVDFENALAIALLKLGSQGGSQEGMQGGSQSSSQDDTQEYSKERMQKTLLVEDEGHLIGRIQVPLLLREKMNSAPLLVIEASLGARSQHIFNEYILTQWQDYQDTFANTAFDAFTNYLLQAVDAIRKRLGNATHQEIRAMLVAALKRQEQHADLALHQRWIEALLRRYYDPMYDYQLAKKASRVVYRGTRSEVLAWCQDRLSNSCSAPTPARQ